MSELFPLKKAKKLLNADREEKLTDEQVQQVLELLQLFAEISVSQFHRICSEEIEKDDRH